MSNFEENLPLSLPVEQFVLETARGKLEVVAAELTSNQTTFDAIVASDTVIHFEGRIIGKPKDPQDAVETLKRLRNTSHDVYSGVAVRFANGDTETFVERTIVTFGDYPDRLVDAYVASGEPLNKAGSYGIQGAGAVFVKGIQGCFPNVVGLPIHRLHSLLLNRALV